MKECSWEIQGSTAPVNKFNSQLLMKLILKFDMFELELESGCHLGNFANFHLLMKMICK